MSRTRRFLSGLTLGYLNQGLMMLVGIWLTPFLLRHVGQHDYGVWIVGSQIVAYLALLDIGVAGLTPREVAYVTGRATGEARSKELRQLIGQLGTILLFQTLAVALAAIIVFIWLPVEWRPYRGPLAVILTTFVVLFPCRIFQAVLDGLQDLAFLGRIQIMVWASSTALTIFLVERGFTLYALAIGWACSQLSIAGVSAARLWSEHASSMPRSLRWFSRDILFYYLKRGFWVSASQITGPLMGSLDVIIISKLFGVSMVVPYSCTMKLTTVLTNQPNLLMQVAGPGLSELKAGGNKQRITRVVTALTQAMLIFSGLVGCVIMVVNKSFVSWWVEPSRFAGLPLTVFAVANMIVRHWNTTATYSVFCFGYERFISFVAAIDGCLTALLYFFLAKEFGLAGIPLGGFLSAICFALPSNLRVLSKETGTHVFGLITPLWPWFWRFVLLFSAAFAVNLRGQVFGIPGMASITIICTLVYVIFMYRPGLVSALGVYLAPRLKALTGRVGWSSAPIQ